ncbi:hypothetical protein [Thalassotalea sp. Y01]|uniref:hypothetical protein n=1 Tax=Thalassotalea sp. Y01 TaxID=2729613 RepID=UPI00145CB939|nr:hypothetical protein [Thalassotalea sp. Y01]NMP16987.1 hypothetical protein [Thalassotalea sp. Y01]
MKDQDLQRLWQSDQQPHTNAGELLKQAKRAQLRMLVLMSIDFLVWLAMVIWASLMIRDNQQPESFAVGVFTIIAVSVATGYLLWLRTSTWGSDALDVKSILKLAIMRCDGAIQIVAVTYMFTALVVIGFVVLHQFYPIPETRINKIVSWLAIYSTVVVAAGQWYRAKQQQKKKVYLLRLQQMQESE